jgi:hypothetical protein
MNARHLIFLFAITLHGLGQSATPGDDSVEPREPSREQRRPDPTVGKESAPGMPAQSGAVNPANGQYYPPAGNGDVINPATGERYIGTSGGYINPNTGEFMPKIR